jgi:GTPase-associated system helical domain
MSDAESRLPSWVRDVDLEPGASRIDAIRGAATDLAKSKGDREILDLVLLAHGRSSGEALPSVAAALREHDESSAVREGDLIASITAAAATAFAMEAAVEIAVPFGLAVCSAHFIGLQPAVPELDALARAGLARASEAQRRRVKLSVVAADVDTALKDWPKLDEGQPVQTENLNSAREAVAGVTSRALPAITRRFNALEEELDVLWWAFGEFSELAAKPLKSLPEQAAGCVAGIELATHTTRRAPLQAARAILSRILQSRADKATDLRRALPAAVKAIGDTWTDHPPVGHPLLPVLSSLEEYRNLGQKPLWIESVSARWEIDATQATTVLDLAEQVSRELLIARPTE